MVGKAWKLHGARYELSPAFGLEKLDQWNPIRTMRFIGFSNHEKGAPRQEISK
jgi:hypothetical protein